MSEIIEPEGGAQMTDLYLAWDVGGTRIKSGIVDGDGRVMARRVDPTEGHRGADVLIDRLVAVGRELLDEVPMGRDVRGAGIAFTGVIDPDAGRVLMLNGKIPDINGVDVGPRISAALDVPCWVDNDTRVYTIGEWQYGAGRGVDNVVCMTLGTGIGSGVISRGEVVRTDGMIGGLLGGHFTVDCDGPLCSCGNRGCLEAVASVPAFLTSVRDHLSRGYPSILSDRVNGDLAALRAEQVIDAVRQGDRLATFCFEQWARRIGAGIVTMVHAYDPDVVILGGGVMQAADVMLPPIERYVHEHAWTWPAGRIQVKACALGDDAALIGGAAMAMVNDRTHAGTDGEAGLP
jgi:glucokinase